MIEKFAFYAKHSLNDMRVNGQRTFFALLCIAAGVAAIVSLQTLAVMIDQTLTGDLQRQNLSDIRAEYANTIFDDDDEGEPIFDPELEAARADAEARDLERGYLATNDDGFFGVEFESTQVTLEGLAAIEADLNAQFPSSTDTPIIEVTGNVLIVDPGAVIIGFGTGVTLNVADADASLTNAAPVMIDVEEYPFYDTITLETGETLAEAYAAFAASGGDLSRGVVVSRATVDAFENIDTPLAVGDEIVISGADGRFTVLGIVPTDTEIRDLEAGFLYGFFGYYYYLDQSALQYFPDVPPLTSNIYVKVNDQTILQDVADYMRDQYPYLEQTTTEDLREINEDISEALEVVVTVMGLLSLLLGSIGIINTMQVVVRRRTIEIAVLKTLGLQGNQVTLLFLMQAFIMGVIGSIFGVLLGWVAVFVIRGAAEGLLFQDLQFTIAADPVINGIIVGTLVTTVFGFLPTLSAAQVRPGVVLRPTETVIPRTGRVVSLLVIAGMVIVLSVIANSVLGGGQFGLALLAVAGAFFAAGVIYVMLYTVIWLLGRLTPSFGLPDLKISKRQMLASRSRGALTLLALVVAVFSLSTITLYADSFTNLLDSLLNEEGSEPVIVQSLVPGTNNETIETYLANSPDVESYSVNRTFNNVDFVTLRRTDGTTYNSVEALNAAIEREGQAEFFTTIALETIGAKELRDAAPEPVIDGMWLSDVTTTSEGTLPMVIIDSDYVSLGVLGLGDRLTYDINGEKLDFEVVGILERNDLSFAASPANLFVRWDDIQPLGLEPDDLNFSAAMPESAVPRVRSDLSEDISALLVIDIRTFSNLIERLLDRFSAFPTMVALLGLVVGGVVIANSVALATLERRKEIAVMKSVGLQRERVLGMILLENGLLGIVGGLVGVGSGLIALVVGSSGIDLPLDIIPYGAAFLLMGLCVIVAVVAAMTTAWGASGEKPLNVLRYE